MDDSYAVTAFRAEASGGLIYVKRGFGGVT